MEIIQSPSTNFHSRRGHKPELIVVHVTDGSFPGDLNWLRTPSSQVSVHYLITPAGKVHQLVAEDQAAWHAGRILNPTAKLLKKNLLGQVINPNLYSIGIEVSLQPLASPVPVQMSALKELVRAIARRNGIPLDRNHVIGHKEIYAAKTCPGPIDMNQLVFDLLPPPPTMVEKNEFKNKIINFIQSL